jgi:N utilization substance protein B
MLTRRSRAREVALQLLFQKDQNPRPVPRPAIERFARDRLKDDPTAAVFSLALYDGVVRHQPEIDKAITATAENWRLTRMMPVDRNLLRLGTFEMLHAADPTPPAVAINEAIELSRRFGSADSPAFVNGILDKISRMRADKPAPPVPSPS